MIEVTAIIQIEGQEPHEEKLPVSCHEKAEEELKQMCDDFNKGLRPFEKPRKFIGLKQDTTQLLHDWHKKNLTGLDDKNGMYDLVECSGCGLQYKAYGLKRRRGGHCYPDRVCKTCNQEFKSEKNCKKHKEKQHIGEGI